MTRPAPDPAFRRLSGLLYAGLAGLFTLFAPALAGPLVLKPATEPQLGQFKLRAEHVWRLDCQSPRRFDASALHRLKDGTWITLDDKTTRLFRIELTGDTGRLVPTDFEFLPKRPARSSVGKAEPRPDVEGLAVDDAGRIYIAEESQRQVLRFDPVTRNSERLTIDWTPVQKWFSSDVNASWEGIAIGGDKLYLANERSTGRIVVVDLATLKVERDFQASPPGVTAADVHYSDLCWHAGQLWVLCRESRCVLRVDAAREKVVAAFDYEAIERDPENAYAHPYPYGFVEGLFVDDTHIWLAVDNNEFPRVADKNDRRPQLWKCPRPDQRGEESKAQSSKLK